MSDAYDRELFGTPAMADVFSDEAHLRAVLAFEAALARAEARVGVIPAEAADAIADACRVELYDIAALYRDAGLAGTLAIPLVRAMTARVAGGHGRHVHFGATSQDALDTALALQARNGLDLLIADMLALSDVLAALAEEHRDTLMAGRTLLQQALPITFGLRAGRWLALATRQTRRLIDVHEDGLVVQFGGAVGTLAALGDAGLAVMDALAGELGLGVPDLPWHTERDRIAELAATLAVLAGAMAKIAGDILLLTQTEVGEAAPADIPGKGGSSAMPHKRNPVDATFAVASARLALGTSAALLGGLAHEHERAAGGWQVEWSALPALFVQTAGAVARTRSAVAELVIDPERMRANLDLTGGLALAEALTVALAPALGRPDAFALVEGLSRRVVAEGVSLRDAALADKRVLAALSVEAIERALDPANYLGSASALIDRALAGHRALRAANGG